MAALAEIVGLDPQQGPLQQRWLVFDWFQSGQLRPCCRGLLTSLPTGLLTALLGLAGLDLQRLLDHPVGEGVEVGRQAGLQLQELRPEVSLTKLRLRRAITVVRRWRL